MTIKLPQRLLQRLPGGHGRPIHQAQKKARRSIDLQLPVHLELMLPYSKRHLDVLRHRIRARTDRYPRRCIKLFELTITQRLIIFTQTNVNPPEEFDDISSTSNGGLLLPGAIEMPEKQIHEQLIQPAQDKDTVRQMLLIRRRQEIAIATAQPFHRSYIFVTSRTSPTIRIALRLSSMSFFGTYLYRSKLP
jgi:hypothetical protein